MKPTLNVSDKTIRRVKQMAHQGKTSVSKRVTKNLEEGSDPDWLVELRRTDPGLTELCGVAKGVKMVSKDQYLRD